MRVIYGLLVGLVLLPGLANAEGPEIQVVNGKVTMTAQGVPLGRVLSLLDGAMGLSSKVKPELAGQTINVRFEDLELKDAVHKIFEGQPLNYVLIEGKGIQVTERAMSTGATNSTSSSSVSTSFPDSQPTTTPLAAPGPVQPIPAQPVNAAAQPAAVPFGGGQQNPGPANPPTPPSNPNVIVPGQVPPPISGANPLVSPPAAVPQGGAAPAAVGFPAVPVQAPPAQPAGPGTVSGATPGAITR